jgi:hypothetical protein
MRCFVPCVFAALMQPRSTSRDTSSYEQQQGTVATVALLYSVASLVENNKPHALASLVTQQ